MYEADQTYTFDCPFHAATDEVRLENTGKNIKLAGSEDGCFYSTVQLKIAAQYTNSIKTSREHHVMKAIKQILKVNY